MTLEVLIAIGSVVCIALGLLATRIWRSRHDAALVRERLTELFHDVSTELDVIAGAAEPDWLESLRTRTLFLDSWQKAIELAGWKIGLYRLLTVSALLLVLPAVLVVAFGDLSILPFALILGALFAALPFLLLHFTAEQRRNKFIDQLPGAIELMISVLRSGLSVPQSVKAVAEEMPAPCGPEFFEVLQRMNLGQSLAESLQYTADRYRVFELDLLRRATSIQMEVGGSLSELLDKTNSTLRQRLQLKRQVRVLTSQSRLSGNLISALPFVIAIAFQMLNPDYLRPLYETNIGRILVVVALSFQIAGMLIMRRIAAFRI